MRERAGQTAVCALILLCGGLAACGLFQPTLPLEAAVARWVPGDPPGAQSDRLIGDREIALAVEHWISGVPVPRTDGVTIDDAAIKRLVERWALRTPVA